MKVSGTLKLLALLFVVAAAFFAFGYFATVRFVS